MANLSSEKNLIQGNVPAGIKEQFDLQIQEHGMSVGRAVEAMCRLWIHLPPEVQVRLYSHVTLADAISTVSIELTKVLLGADQERLAAAEYRLKKKQEDRNHNPLKPDKSA